MFKTIRSKFLFVYIVLIVVAIGILTMAFSYATSSSYKEQALNQTMQITRLHAKSIGETLKYHVAVLQEEAKEDIFKQPDISVITSTLKSMIDSENYLFEHVFFVSLDGVSYKMTGELGNVTDREYYQVHLQDQLDYYIGEPLIGRTLNKPAFHISVPIYNNNELHGILVGAIPLELLVDELKDKKLTGDSYGWIMDSQGTFIAHPIFKFEDAVNLYELANSQNEGEKVVPKPIMSDEGNTSFTSRRDQKQYEVVFTRIEYSPGWKLGIVYEEKSILSSRDDLIMNLIIISFAIVILFVGVTVFLTSNIVKPIAMLTEATGNGSFLEDDLSRLQRNQEVSQLFDSYNQMHKSIKNHTLELENKVNQRTIELKKANQELFKMATRDNLTGLLNREQLHSETDKMIEMSNSDEQSGFVVMFMDLDNFKYYNDSFGHDIGDQLLIQVSKFLTASFSSSDVIFRYGGDEFVALIPNADELLAEKIGERIKYTFKSNCNYKAKLGEWLQDDSIEIPKDKELSISWGYSVYNKQINHTTDSLVKEADMKMYEMKKDNK